MNSTPNFFFPFPLAIYCLNITIFASLTNKREYTMSNIILGPFGR